MAARARPHADHDDALKAFVPGLVAVLGAIAIVALVWIALGWVACVTGVVAFTAGAFAAYLVFVLAMSDPR